VPDGAGVAEGDPAGVGVADGELEGVGVPEGVGVGTGVDDPPPPQADRVKLSAMTQAVKLGVFVGWGDFMIN
jgi:hypothetical protein